MQCAGLRTLLLIIITCGIVLRFVGLTWGIPCPMPPGATASRSSYHFDEGSYLRLLALTDTGIRNFEVRDIHWGTLQFYLIGIALQFAESSGYLSGPWRKSFLEMNPADFPRIYLVGRMVSTISGIFALWLVFLLGRRFANTETGLAGAALLAVSPLHVVNSHFLTSDITMVSLTLAALCFLFNLERAESRSARILSGLFLGLAISAKYNAGFLVPLWIVRDISDRAASWKKKWLSYAFMIIGFGLGEPHGLIRLKHLIYTLYEDHMSAGAAKSPFLPSAHRLLADQTRALAIYGLGLAAAVAAGVGIFHLLRSGTRRNLLLMGAMLLFVLSLLVARWPMVRYTLPLIPLLALAAVIPIATSRLRDGRRALFYVFLAAVPLLHSFAHIRILMSEHPANAAARWVEANIPPGGRIGQIWPALPPLDVTRYDLHTLRGLFGYEEEGSADRNRQLLILDNLPIAPLSNEFLERLARDYELAVEFRLEPRLGPWVLPERNAPHDWKYTHPTVRIYRRR